MQLVPGMFPDTRWSPLAEAAPHGDEADLAAQEGLRRAYGEPVRRFGPQLGWPPDASPDPAQSFLIQVMDKALPHGAERKSQLRYRNIPHH